MSEPLVKSVAKAGGLLDLFRSHEELGLSELAALSGLSKSTAYGLADSLVHVGLLEQVPETGRYRLGLAAFEFGQLYVQRYDLLRDAGRVCQPLADQHNVTVQILTPDAHEAVYLAKFEPTGASVVWTRVGSRMPLHTLASGKALLAELEDDYLETHVLSRPLEALTPRTITDPERLRAEIVRTRQRGYGEDHQECQTGVVALGLALPPRTGGPHAAVSISALAADGVWERLRRLLPELTRVAQELSKQLPSHP